jgi:hypothetical protein
MSRIDSLTQIRVRLTHVTTEVSPTSLERIRQAWAGVPMMMSLEGQTSVHVVQIGLLFCQKCQVQSTNLRIDHEHSSCLRVVCSGSCSRNPSEAVPFWCACRTCSSRNQRVQFKYPKHLTRHGRRFHQPSVPAEPAGPLFDCAVSDPPLVEDLDDCWPPPPPPPHEELSQFASDLFLASLLLDLNPDDLDAQEASHPPNFASLFDNQLTIPPHMGAINEKKVALQRRRSVSYFEREHQSPGFGASGLLLPLLSAQAIQLRRKLSSAL